MLPRQVLADALELPITLPAERARTGRRVLGRRAVSARRCCAIARSSWSTPALATGGENGIPAVFPPGTYWLQRFASVPVLET
jgi:hypothetical protein